MPEVITVENKDAVNKSVSSSGQPSVYQAVRAVGIVNPTYQPNSKSFGNRLNVVGTAFWLKEYKVLVTCAHVVHSLLVGRVEQTGLLVVGKLGKYSRARIASLDLSHDLAILEIADEPQAFVDNEAESGLEIIGSYPQVGTSVGYAGFPMGLQLLDKVQSPTYAEGVVGVQLRERPGCKEIQITGAVVGGYSGAPVVAKNESSKIIGVVSSGPGSAGTQGNIFMAISWVHVEALAKLARS